MRILPHGDLPFHPEPQSRMKKNLVLRCRWLRLYRVHHRQQRGREYLKNIDYPSEIYLHIYAVPYPPLSLQRLANPLTGTPEGQSLFFPVPEARVVLPPWVHLVAVPVVFRLVYLLAGAS